MSKLAETRGGEGKGNVKHLKKYNITQASMKIVKKEVRAL